jgi:hypothetical protein
MGTAFKPAKTSPASWDAFSNVEAFVDAVLSELVLSDLRAACRERPQRIGSRGPF